jgi:hypothetical protein
MFGRCGGMEFGLTTCPMSLNQQPPDHQAQEQQKSRCDTEDQVQVEFLFVF